MKANGTLLAMCIATATSLAANARAEGTTPPAAPAPAPAPAETAVAPRPVETPTPAVPAPVTPPAPTAAPSPDQRAEPPVLVPEPAPVPAPEQPQPSPPTAPAPVAPPPPAQLGAATTTPAERAIPSLTPPAPPPPGLALGVELAAGMTAGGRFPQTETGRSVEEAVDATYGLSVWLGGRGAVYGLSLERTGLGKDHYATNANGETMEASYAADTLSLLGRWYFSKERPALYLGLSLGAALPTERTTGTRAPEGVFVTPGESYSCSATGRIGGTASASVGVEFEVANRLAVLADARVAGFLMSRSASAFGGCAPGTGNALGGALRIGVSYRFGL